MISTKMAKSTTFAAAIPSVRSTRIGALALLLWTILLQNIVECKLTKGGTVVEVREKIKNNQFIVVIFCDVPADVGSCKDVTEHAGEYFRRDQIKSFPGIEAIVTDDHQLAKMYGVHTFPRLAFFRDGIPIFHEHDELELIDTPEWMSKHREVHSIRLNDANFEHDTQATTGATTGDWLILFYDHQCTELLAVWERLAVGLAQMKVVALVDTSRNLALKKRFHMLNDCPDAVMLSRGKMYRHVELSSLYKEIFAFAREGFQKTPSEPIPLPAKTPGIGDSVVAFSTFLITYPVATYPLLVGAALVAIFVVICVIKRNRDRRSSKFE